VDHLLYFLLAVAVFFTVLIFAPSSTSPSATGGVRVELPPAHGA
jgi:hypothetical protein